MRHDPEDRHPEDRDLERVVGLLSTMTADDHEHDDLPDGLWDLIAARVSTSDQPTVLASDAELRLIGAGEGVPTDPAHRPAGSPQRSTGADVVDLNARRRQRWVRIAAAAAVVVIAAGTYGAIRTNAPGTTQELVASVDLEPLKDSGIGRAELMQVDGQGQLRITARGLPPAPEGHHYEMWLIDTGVTDPQSLGPLTPGGNEIVVDVPPGIDPAAFPIVDINVQVDGEEQHSGVDTSVLRGVLA